MISTHRPAVAALLLGSFLLASCVAHEKAGDSAAAVGDWKAAVNAYRAAVAEDPDDPALREKYARARREAASGAWRKAQSCAAANEWQCAMAEADYALSIDEGNAEFAAFRAHAAKAYAHELLQGARDASTRGDFVAAFHLLNQGTGLSRDPAVQQDTAQTRTQVLHAAEFEAERRRSARELREAVELWTLIAQADASKSGRLEEVRLELENQLAWEYEQHTKRGDTALAQRRWGDAEQHYLAALAVKPGGRAEGLAAYANAVARGEAAVAARDFAAAARGYRDAVATGLDATGYASRQLQLVEIRPYAVRIRSVLVKPARPNGQPWAGAPTALFWTSVKLLEAYIPKIVRDVVSAAAIDAAEAIPMANRPLLHVEATLPDGTKLKTPDKRAVYANWDSEFVVTGNVFDERRVVLKVFGGPDAGEEVGIMEILVKDLIAHPEATLKAQSVLALKVGTGSADGKAESSYAGMTPVGGQPARATVPHGAGAVRPHGPPAPPPSTKVSGPTTP